MKGLVIAIVTAVLLLSCCGTADAAAVIWGTTGSGTGSSSQSEVFILDTATMEITNLTTTAPGWVHGDIAVTPSSAIYTVGIADGGAWGRSIMRLDPVTGEVVEYWRNIIPTGYNVNGLTAESDTALLGESYGTGGATLIRIELDGTGAPITITNLGQIDAQTSSGGDVVQIPGGDYIAATDGGRRIYRITDVSNPASATLEVSGMTPEGIGALAYDYRDEDGPLYAGSWLNSTIYILDLTTGVLSSAPVINPGEISWGIYGMGVEYRLPSARRNILLTGYWPPTAQMLVRFSIDSTLNPEGWIGENWENRGYDVYAYFPSSCPSGTRGEGDLQVDYQDTSQDFWSIVDALHPIAIMGYGLGGGPWELEATAYNFSSWSNDYLDPRQPTPSPPDDGVPAGYIRYSTLPMEAIRDAINSAGIGVSARIDPGGAGGFLCGFMSYHDCWYQSLHSSPADPYYCAAAGFTHVSGMPVASATAAAEIALRTTIGYLGEAENYSLTVTVDGLGTVQIDPEQVSYEPDTEVILTAIPIGGSTFDGWDGDAGGTDNPIVITMDNHKVITASFSGGTVDTSLIWGVTGGAYSEVFTLDTTTMTLDVKTTTPAGWVHADIAVTPSGNLYTVGTPGGGTTFGSLMRLDPFTGEVTTNWTLPVPMNALTAESDTTLLGVLYGGTANVYRIELDGSGNYLSCTDLGQINGQSSSGGDIAHTPDDDYIASTSAGAQVWRIPVVAGNPDPVSAGYVCATTSGVGAFAYDYYDPALTLYAARWQESTIYTLDLATGVLTPAAIANPGEITLGVYGMDVAKPEVPDQYSLAVSVEGLGEVQVEPDQVRYDPGTEVTLTAVPGEGAEFIDWSGDAGGDTNPIIITMDSSKEITANFTRGVIDTSLIWGVTGGAYSEVFTLDTSTMTIMTKTTTASGWVHSDIAVTPSGNVYTVGTLGGGTTFGSVMRLDTITGEVTAHWALPVQMNGLTAESDTSLLGMRYGSSSAEVYRIDLDGAGNYVGATSLGLMAVAGGGSDIAHTPGGDYIAAVDVGAQIWRIPIDAGNPDPAGSSYVCSTTSGVGALAYDYGDPALTLYAARYQESTIYTLDLTTGALVAAAIVNPEAITLGVYGMDVAKPEMPETYTLTLDIVGMGTVNIEPNQALYDPGTEVTLTAIPGESATFASWGGDASGDTNPIIITMDSDKEITANFTYGPIDTSLIWGVTGGAYSEVFTLDTATMTITTRTTTASGWVHADIAVTPSGNLYTVGTAGPGSSTFTSLMRLDPYTGDVVEHWNLSPLAMNALTAESDTSLLGVRYGSGSAADVIRIGLDGAGDYTSHTVLGRIDAQSGSGGDIEHTPNGDYIAATSAGAQVWRIPIAAGNPVPTSASYVCATTSGVGAFAYDYYDPALTLYAARWQESTIYTLDLTTGVLTPAAIINPAAISLGVYGLGIANPIVTVPDVVGLSQADAESAITGAELAVGAVSHSYHNTVPAGDVISQDPVGGTSVVKGSAVDLLISDGPEMVAVPDVVGMSQADAGSAITGAELTVGTISYSYHDTVPAGDVISQEPVGGTPVIRGSAVNLVISDGPETAPYVVYGLHSLFLQSAVITGNVGARDAQSGDWINPKMPYEIEINTATINGSAYGDTVKLGPTAHVTGDAYCNEAIIWDAHGAILDGSVISPLDLPVADPSPVFPAFEPGLTDIILTRSETIVLPAGDYGRVELLAGTYSNRTVLQLEGGVYNLSELVLGYSTQVECLAPCQIRIKGRLSARAVASLVAASGSGLSAGDIEIFVEGMNGDTGGVSEVPKAVTLGKVTETQAHIYAPNGTIEIGVYMTTARGVFVGKWVSVSGRTTVVTLE